MPVLAFQSRYRPRSTPFEQGVMSPFEDEVQPAFDPRLMDAPPPQAISDTRIDAPRPNTPAAMPPITAAMPTQGASSGPRKPFLMPPPGTPPQPKLDAELPPAPEVQAPQMPPQARGAMSPPPRKGSEQFRGLLQPGNIDLDNRPVVNNPDGSVSTEFSKSWNFDGKEVLLPTVINGRRVSDEEAIAHYRQTGENLGTFDTPENADAYAEVIHNRQGGRVSPQARGAMPPPPLTAELPPLEVKQPGAVGVPTGPDAREVMGDRPPSQADLALKDKEKVLADKLAARPAAPKENWGTRLATAILAMTKFAPATDLIVHPKWSSQERQYGRDLEVAGQQFKVAQEALNSETMAEQREANSAMKNAQAAQAGVADATRRDLNNPHRNEREIDPEYAAKNLPGLKPDAEGRYWVADSTLKELVTPRTDPTASHLELPPDVAKKYGIAPGTKMPPAQWEVLVKAAHPERKLHFENSTNEITGDVTVTAYDEATGERVTQSVQKGVGQKRPPAIAAGGSADDAKVIADAIYDGLQQPTLQGLYGKGAAVRADLGRRGYDLATATRDWTAIQRHLGTLNGQQQERLRQAVSFTRDSLDIIDDLYSKWLKAGPASGFKVFNRAALQAAKQLPGDTGSIATNLEAQINDLTSELGTVYKGGNASTDESLRLAAENLKADWNEKTFKTAMGQIRKNLKIRGNSIMNSQPVGVSPNSPYLPPMGGEIAPAPVPGGTRVAQGGYEIGAVYNGLRYLGGDINDQKSWEAKK